MILPKLYDQLEICLYDAEEIFIAVALIKDFGFSFIETRLPDGCSRKYVLGIDLPTAPSVLYEICALRKKSALIDARLAAKVTYHPKVYIIKHKSGQYSAFIGSGNATLGGLQNNVEMNFRIDDQAQCLQLLEWFFVLFNTSDSFDNDYVSEYEKVYRRNAVSRSRERSNIDHLLKKPTQSVTATLIISPTQFFTQTDFDALNPIYHTDNSQHAKELRKGVWNRLRFLDKMIFPDFSKYGINDLHQHYDKRLITSLYYHARGNLNAIDAIWLNYGKSKSQLNSVSFTSACRIQVIIRNNTDGLYVGVWLFIGKPRGSIEDRRKLKRQLLDDSFSELFYQYYQELGDSYWISLGNVPDEEVRDGDLKDFRETLQRDDFSDYYIIGRNYHPNDEAISINNIKETVLVEFAKLYKLYKLIVSSAID